MIDFHLPIFFRVFLIPQPILFVTFYLQFLLSNNEMNKLAEGEVIDRAWEEIFEKELSSCDRQESGLRSQKMQQWP